MDKRTAKATGKRYGYSAGEWCDGIDGDACECGDHEWDTDAIDAARDSRDAWDNAQETLSCFAGDSERHTRCYSPWEFVAHEINSATPEWRPEGLWEAYDEGVSLGISLAIRARLGKRPRR